MTKKIFSLLLPQCSVHAQPMEHSLVPGHSEEEALPLPGLSRAGFAKGTTWNACPEMVKNNTILLNPTENQVWKMLHITFLAESDILPMKNPERFSSQNIIINNNNEN